MPAREKREDCEVGDWVKSEAVPEWDTVKLAHPFYHPDSFIRPDTDSAHHVPVPPVKGWVFCRDVDAKGYVWTRSC